SRAESDRRDHQSPGRFHRRGDVRRARDRDQGVGAGEQRHRGPQGRDRPAGRARRPAARQACQLDAVHPPEQRGVGHLRLVGRLGAPWWRGVSHDVRAGLGIASVLLVMLLGESRVFSSMSRAGLLGPWAGKVHPLFRTPYLATTYTGIAVCLATGLLPLQLLGTWVNIGTLLAFVLVCAGVWILRHTRPDLERPFRTPLVPLVPILGMVSCFGLMLTLPL